MEAEGRKGKEGQDYSELLDRGGKEVNTTRMIRMATQSDIYGASGNSQTGEIRYDDFDSNN